MYNKEMKSIEMKSKQIQRNVGKFGVPELSLHPVYTEPWIDITETTTR